MSAEAGAAAALAAALPPGPAPPWEPGAPAGPGPAGSGQGGGAAAAPAGGGQLQERALRLRERLLAVKLGLWRLARGAQGQGSPPAPIGVTSRSPPPRLQVPAEAQGLPKLVDNTSLGAATARVLLARLGNVFHRAHAGNKTKPDATDSAADVQGISENSAEDLRALRSNLLLQLGVILVSVIFFSIGRLIFPLVYQGEDEATHHRPPEEFYFSWVGASVSLSVQDVTFYAGVDRGMFIMFLNFAMSVMLAVGVPLTVVLCPLHFYYGGQAAGQDELSQFDMANVKQGSWLCWVHAAAVWYVVLTVNHMVHSQKRLFIDLRIAWLRSMPAPRSNTVLVEDIPEGWNTSEKLAAYFDDKVFGKKVVDQCFVVKDSTELLKAITKSRHADHMVEMARSRNRRNVVLKAMGGPQHENLAAQIHWQQQVEVLRKEIDQRDDLNIDTAFVTFLRRRDAAIVLRLFTPRISEDISVSLPMEPSDIIWEDFIPKKSEEVQVAREGLGYLLVAGVFILFVPFALVTAAIARWESLHATFGNLGFNFDPFAYAQQHYPEQVALWNGLVGTVVLTVLMSMVPSFLMWIFATFFVLKARTQQQHKVQTWYFYFLVVFVLLVTAIGSSDFGLLQTVTFLVRNPLEIFPRLAEKMPSSTHFYLEYLVVQWGVQAFNITRFMNLLKYLVLLSYNGQSGKAKAASEPEDQDFYGIGSLSARATLNLTIALVFCTLTPFICIVAIVGFAIARLVHGYLAVYAETRKDDIGGDFFVRQLVHTQQGLFLYVTLMTGVLTKLSDSWVPGFLSASTFPFLFDSYYRFKREFQLREMGLHEIQEDDDFGMYEDVPPDEEEAGAAEEPLQPLLENTPTYKQPELPPPVRDPVPETPTGWPAWLSSRAGAFTSGGPLLPSRGGRSMGGSVVSCW